VALLALGVSLIGASAWLFNYIRQMFSARVTSNVVLKLREDVFNATVRHDLSFYDEHPSGKIVSRVTSDTVDFADVVNLTLNLVSQVLQVLIVMIYLLTINARLTLLLLAMAPLAAVLALSFRRLARRVTTNARRVTAIINAQIQESISGIQVAKTFRQEPAIYATFDANNRQGYRVGLTRGLTLSGIFPILGVGSGLGTAVLVYFGGLSTRTSISPAEWYLFMQAVGLFWFPMTSIASFWSQFQDGLSAAERVFALIDREPRVQQIAAEPVGSRIGAGGREEGGGWAELPRAIFAGAAALSGAEREMLFTCALRFDGYRYQAATGDDLPALLAALVERDAMPEGDERRMAVFFLLQRGLGKWGLERATADSRTWGAFRRLYLAVHDRPVPEAYAAPEYVSEWAARYADQAAAWAALVASFDCWAG